MRSTIISRPLEIALKFCSIWPDGKRLRGPLIIIFAAFIILPFQCWKALLVTDDPVLLMDVMSNNIIISLLMWKLIIIWSNRRNFDILLRIILADWSSKKIPQSWNKYAVYSKRFCIANFVIYFQAGIMYFPQVFLAYYTGPEEKRIMIFEAKYPFNALASPNYEYCTISQIIAEMILVYAFAVTESFLVALVLHLVVKITSLKDTFNEISKLYDKYPGKAIINWDSVLTEHKKVVYFGQLLINSYAKIALIQVGWSVLLICVSGYVIITSGESDLIQVIKFVSFLFGMLCQAFALCFAGQYIENQSFSLHDEICACPWYNAPLDDMKILLFIILRTQTPIRMIAGNMFYLSLRNFTSILKTSVSYLSVLRAKYN